jgi:hypothetical protein
VSVSSSDTADNGASEGLYGGTGALIDLASSDIDNVPAPAVSINGDLNQRVSQMAEQLKQDLSIDGSIASDAFLGLRVSHSAVEELLPDASVVAEGSEPAMSPVKLALERARRVRTQRARPSSDSRGRDGNGSSGEEETEDSGLVITYEVVTIGATDKAKEVGLLLELASEEGATDFKGKIESKWEGKELAVPVEFDMTTKKSKRLYKKRNEVQTVQISDSDGVIVNEVDLMEGKPVIANDPAKSFFVGKGADEALTKLGWPHAVRAAVDAGSYNGGSDSSYVAAAVPPATPASLPVPAPAPGRVRAAPAGDYSAGGDYDPGVLPFDSTDPANPAFNPAAQAFVAESAAEAMAEASLAAPEAMPEASAVARPGSGSTVSLRASSKSKETTTAHISPTVHSGIIRGFAAVLVVGALVLLAIAFRRRSVDSDSGIGGDETPVLPSLSLERSDLL